MSLLAGLGRGLQEAGRAAGNNLAAYSQMLNQQDRDKMRQASMDKRWAVEESRYKASQAKSEASEAKSDVRYEESKALNESRYQETKSRQELMDNASVDRAYRQDDRESANALSSGIERLDKIRTDKEKQIKEMFTDPMTKSVMDPDGYNAAMSALRDEYSTTAATLVQRSGLSEQQINKYGFSAYLPDEQPAAKTPEAVPTMPTPEPTTPMPDIASLASKVRSSKPNAAKASSDDYSKMTGKDAALEYLLNDRGQINQPMGMLRPEQIKRQQQLNQSSIKSAYGAASLPTY
ncbi:hypothetical protein [Shewanella sp. T24-MNA-CIBAN-0130]|uniref:hypothetical protein n=1 Tax=Shewanella sp. T24-MNA-CIBAN-0130 TaxID=3140470 RepID=UPI00331BD77D